MPFSHDLLEQAKHLANSEKKKPRQASLRRGVSTAYYALFHLLIHEASLNWRRVDQRAILARLFEHGKMKAASDKQRGECNRYIGSSPPPTPGRELDCIRHLRHVAGTFSQVQQQRHVADYDSSKQWTRTEVLTLMDLVQEAFESWREIRDEPTAQTYLISLLGTPRADR
jgi:uncharacterized protein (UPF0332 family)